MTFAEALEVLRVQLPLTPEEAARAFRRRAKETHPDVGGDPAEFRRVVQAVEIATAALRSAARGEGPIRFDPVTGDLDWREVARRQMSVAKGPFGSAVHIELSIEQTNRLTGDGLGKILQEGASAFLVANGRGRRRALPSCEGGKGARESKRVAGAAAAPHLTGPRPDRP